LGLGFGFWLGLGLGLGLGLRSDVAAVTERWSAVVAPLALLRPWPRAGRRRECGDGQKVLEVLPTERLGTCLGHGRACTLNGGRLGHCLGRYGGGRLARAAEAVAGRPVGRPLPMGGEGGGAELPRAARAGGVSPRRRRGGAGAELGRCPDCTLSTRQGRACCRYACARSPPLGRAYRSAGSGTW
jgi:hypothetical protein